MRVLSRTTVAVALVCGLFLRTAACEQPADGDNEITKVSWGVFRDGMICRSELDGSDVEVVIDSGQECVWGLAFDYAHEMPAMPCAQEECSAVLHTAGGGNAAVVECADLFLAVLDPLLQHGGIPFDAKQATR